MRPAGVTAGAIGIGHLSLLCAFAQSAASCTSYGAHLTATPTPAGHREVAVHADAVVTQPNGEAQVRPNTELGYRWGLGENIDIGFRGHGMGGEVNSRLRLASGYGFDLTASPFIGGGLIPNHEENAGALRFPMGLRALVTWHAPAGVSLTTGATGMFEPQVGFLGDDQRSQLLAAPGVLFSTQFPLGETLWLNVEVNAHLPYALETNRWMAPVLQGGVALKWLAF